MHPIIPSILLSVASAPEPSIPVSGELATPQPVALCENRWFAAEGTSGKLFLGYLYIDPEAGFTFEHYGDFRIDGGQATVVKSDLRDKARLIVRVTNNFPARCLTPTQATALGLEPNPAWMKFYEDKRAPGEHHANWAYFYNHIGASEIALEHVSKALAAGESSESLAFEHAFALNVLSRFDEVVALLTPNVSRTKSGDLVAELAYAHLMLAKFEEAIGLYSRAIDLGSSRRWEFATNIAGAYERLGDTRKRDEWLNRASDFKAKDEAPE
jgi:tetratricopeptide (TPR) repeat protein